MSNRTSPAAGIALVAACCTAAGCSDSGPMSGPITAAECPRKLVNVSADSQSRPTAQPSGPPEELATRYTDAMGWGRADRQLRRSVHRSGDDLIEIVFRRPDGGREARVAVRRVGDFWLMAETEHCG